MSGSASYIMFFITTSVYYYFIKPTTTFNENYDEYTNRCAIYSAIYLFVNIILQIIASYFIVASTCSTNTVSQSFSSAFFSTFFVWVFMFGIIISVLMIIPSFKIAFSNTIGYYYISSVANEVLKELMAVNSTMRNKIEHTKDISQEDKIKLEETTENIIKIFGNTSTLINEITPENFIYFWDNILTPLFKDKYKIADDTTTIELKTKLFNAILSKDNVAECLWYIYIAILAISITQYNLSKTGCAVTQESIMKNYDQYMQVKNDIDNTKAQANSQIYVG